MDVATFWDSCDGENFIYQTFKNPVYGYRNIKSLPFITMGVDIHFEQYAAAHDYY